MFFFLVNLFFRLVRNRHVRKWRTLLKSSGSEIKERRKKKQAKQFVWKLGSSGVNPQLIRAKAGDQSRPISISLQKKRRVYRTVQVGINPLFMENHQQIRVWTKLEREREREREREPHAWNGEPSVTLWRWLQYYNKKNIYMYITSKRLSLSLFRREQDGASKRRAVCCHEWHVRRPVRDPARWQKRNNIFCSTKM
jgi:hypothetical protein